MDCVQGLLWRASVAAGMGLEAARRTTRDGAIGPCVPANVTAAGTKADPSAAAKKAGLRTGDKIVSIAGIPVHNWTQMGKAIRSQPTGTPVTVVVERHGRPVTLHASLARLTGQGT